jgi:hypothetical protein
MLATGPLSLIRKVIVRSTWDIHGIGGRTHQPNLDIAAGPNARGIDSPTLLLRRDDRPGGIYPIFEQLYEAVAERSRQL